MRVICAQMDQPLTAADRKRSTNFVVICAIFVVAIAGALLFVYINWDNGKLQFSLLAQLVSGIAIYLCSLVVYIRSLCSV